MAFSTLSMLYIPVLMIRYGLFDSHGTPGWSAALLQVHSICCTPSCLPTSRRFDRSMSQKFIFFAAVISIFVLLLFLVCFSMLNRAVMNDYFVKSPKHMLCEVDKEKRYGYTALLCLHT